MTRVEPVGAFGESEPVSEPTCDICGEPSIARYCEYTGETDTNLCARCTPEEPGDSFYEGRG